MLLGQTEKGPVKSCVTESWKPESKNGNVFVFGVCRVMTLCHLHLLRAAGNKTQSSPTKVVIEANRTM